jgi:hypothetical protein
MGQQDQGAAPRTKIVKTKIAKTGNGSRQLSCSGEGCVVRVNLASEAASSGWRLRVLSGWRL